MAKGIIQLCYRKTIDTSSSTAWEKMVFEDTHLEFYMQAQQFDQQGHYATFTDMLKHLPRADQMHYLVSTAAMNYIRQLNSVMPDVHNAFGQACIPFSNFRFEIVQSHVRNKALHKVAIYFYSDPVTWIDTFAQQLLIANGDQREALHRGQPMETTLLPWRNDLSIHHFQTISWPLIYQNAEN